MRTQQEQERAIARKFVASYKKLLQKKVNERDKELEKEAAKQQVRVNRTMFRR